MRMLNNVVKSLCSNVIKKLGFRFKKLSLVDIDFILDFLDAIYYDNIEVKPEKQVVYEILKDYGKEFTDLKRELNFYLKFKNILSFMHNNIIFKQIKKFYSYDEFLGLLLETVSEIDNLLCGRDFSLNSYYNKTQENLKTSFKDILVDFFDILTKDNFNNFDNLVMFSEVSGFSRDSEKEPLIYSKSNIEKLFKMIKNFFKEFRLYKSLEFGIENFCKENSFENILDYNNFNVRMNRSIYEVKESLVSNFILPNDLFYVKAIKNDLLIKTYEKKVSKKSNIYLLLDISGSMGEFLKDSETGVKYKKVEILKSILLSILNNAYETEKFEFKIYYFTDIVVRVDSLVTKNEILGYIKKIFLLNKDLYSNGTNIYNVYKKAFLNILKENKPVDGIFMITDSEDSMSQGNLYELLYLKRKIFEKLPNFSIYNYIINTSNKVSIYKGLLNLLGVILPIETNKGLVKSCKKIVLQILNS